MKTYFEANKAGFRAPDWTGLMAGTVVSIVPTILLFIFFGRRVVDSIQFSGFK